MGVPFEYLPRSSYKRCIRSTSISSGHAYSNLPAFQRQSHTFKEGVEIPDLFQHASRIALIANFARDTFEKEFNSNHLDKAMCGLMRVLLLSAFDG
jgi:hypothetical protein